MHVDVAVGTVVGAQAAADAPVFDDDLQRVAPPDRADRTADHAERVATLAAGSGDQIFVEAQAFADQAADAVVSIGAGADALIAARALLQIEHQQALRLHQSLGQELIDRHILCLDGMPHDFLQYARGRCASSFWRTSGKRSSMSWKSSPEMRTTST